MVGQTAAGLAWITQAIKGLTTSMPSTHWAQVTQVTPDLLVTLEHDETFTPRPVSANAAGDVQAGQRVLLLRERNRLTIIGTSGAAWADLPLTGGWESYGGSFGSAQWRIVGDMVELRGMIRRGQPGTDAARIELGRPVTARTRVLSAMTTSGPERIDVAGDGTALRLTVPAASTGATTWVSLEGLRTSI